MFPRHGAIKGKCTRFGTLLFGSGMHARNLCEWGGGGVDGSALSPADVIGSTTSELRWPHMIS